VQSGRLNAVSSGGRSAIDAAAATAQAQMSEAPATDVKFCAIDDPTCEACQ
jgi:ribonucleoside-diphosphate reductase alpha chain